jgi:hypothetical protein
MLKDISYTDYSLCPLHTSESERIHQTVTSRRPLGPVCHIGLCEKMTSVWFQESHLQQRSKWSEDQRAGPPDSRIPLCETPRLKWLGNSNWNLDQKRTEERVFLKSLG